VTFQESLTTNARKDCEMAKANYTPETPEINDELFRLLTRDEMKTVAIDIDTTQARVLIEMYFDWQKNRVGTNNRVKAALKEDTPTNALQWMLDNQFGVEKQLNAILGKYAKKHPVGEWMMKQLGVGPVLAAGFLAFLDPHKAPTAGHFFSYAGMTPAKQGPRKRGEKLTHNPTVKKLCWYIGECAVKVSNKENAVYGRAYRDYVEKVTRENEEGKWEACALALAETRNYGEDTEAMKTLKKGKLPKLIIHQRGKHSAILLFLSHLHQVWRKHEGLSVPEPWVLMCDRA